MQLSEISAKILGMKNSSWFKNLVAVVGLFLIVYAAYKKFAIISRYFQKWWGELEVNADKLELEVKERMQDKIDEWKGEAVKTVTKKIDKLEKQAKKVAKNAGLELNDRQKEIYELIRKEVELNMARLVEKIPNVTDRTLRRDMTKLERLGLVTQAGKTRDSVYKLKD